MKNKKFTLLQLFSIFDGRLSTEIGDVYDMLNHITGEELMTHHLPTAFTFLKQVNPQWFNDGKAKLRYISNIEFSKADPKDVNFESFIKIIKEKYNETYDVPALTSDEKFGFEAFMINNSLLK